MMPAIRTDGSTRRARRRLRAALPLLLPLLLAACAGGSSQSVTPRSVQALAGLAPPAETAEAQLERASGLLARSDSLILSTYYSETDSPEVPPFRYLSECGGARCAVTDPATGRSQAVRISDIELVSGGARALGTGHGVTLGTTASGHMGRDVTAFGAWMDHSGFSVQTTGQTVGDIAVDSRNGIAGGILTGARPAGTAAQSDQVLTSTNQILPDRELTPARKSRSPGASTRAPIA